MKKLVFRNKETGKLKSFYCSDEISNIKAAHQFKEANGKNWGLVMSKQHITKQR